ncbi:MAG: T9SS type A sorting domain-containing protein [Flavobacteriaceae bacterium]|nr:T9SS type A sorting domain-containing protein [Flavobacteriaceae bacterium]
MKANFYLLIFFFFALISNGQDFNWLEDFDDIDEINSCNAQLSINNNNNNLSNHSKTLVICPDESNPESDATEIQFLNWSLNTSFVSFTIYDGDDSTAPILYNFTDNTILPDFYITSSLENSSGCLTIQIETDPIPNIINIGFDMTISCRDECADFDVSFSYDGIGLCDQESENIFEAGTDFTVFSNVTQLTGTTVDDLTYEWYIDDELQDSETTFVTANINEVGSYNGELRLISNFGFCESIHEFEFTIGGDLINTSDADEDFTLEELISDVLISGNCANVNNIELLNGLSFHTNEHSIGYFEAGCSDFPFTEGIVLGSGSISNVTDGNQNGSNPPFGSIWQGDPDLDSFGQSASGNSNATSNDATAVEFFFSSFEEEIEFNYIFGSYEYPGIFVCNFADIFAFIISGPYDEDGNLISDTFPEGTPGVFQDEYLYNHDGNPNNDLLSIDLGGLNIATFEDENGNLVPTTISNIHDFSDINGDSCFEGSLGEFYFPELYNSNEFNYHTLNGETVPLTASAEVIPCERYKLKIVVADWQDSFFNSFVFLEGGSFELGANLGDDVLFSDQDPAFEGDVVTLSPFQNELDDNCDLNIEWYKDGELLEGFTETTLDVTETGTYEIFIDAGDSNLSGCNDNDSVFVEFIPVPNPDNIENLTNIFICDPETPTVSFDFTVNEIIATQNQNPNNFNVSFHLSETEAVNNLNPIEDISDYQVNASELINENVEIWIRVEEALTGNAQTSTTANFEIGIIEIDLEEVDLPVIALCSEDDTAVVAEFNLTDNEELISTIIGTTTVNYSYYTSLADATNASNSISDPETYTSNETSETLFIRVESGFDNDCFDITSFDLGVFENPTPTSVQDLEACVENDEAFIDLTQNNETSIGLPNPSIVELGYYLTQAEAENQVDAIEEIENFLIPQGIEELEVFVRIENNEENGNCTVIESFLVSTVSIDTNEIENLEECELNEVEVSFNLNLVLNGLFTDEDNAINYSTSFYTSLNDANNEVNQIDNLDNYSSVGEETIYLKITDDASTNACSKILDFELIIVPKPIIDFEAVNPSACSEDGFFSNFDFSTLGEIMSIESDSDYSFSYHLSESDASNNVNAISFPFENTNAFNQTIYVRVFDNTTGCLEFGSFEIDVNTTLNIENPANLEACANNEEIYEYDLTTIENEVLGGISASEFSFSYYLTQEDLDNQVNQITTPTNFETNEINQQIFFEVTNVSGECNSNGDFFLIEKEFPTVNLDLPIISNCGEGGFAVFNFENLIPLINIEENVDLEISFHATQTDAQENINPIIGDYINEEPTEQMVFVRIELLETECTSITNFTIQVSDDFEVSTPNPLIGCDPVGFTEFDLTEVEPELFTGLNSENYQVNYFTSEQDAVNSENPIETPEAFVNTVENGQTVFFRVDALEGECFTTGNFDLIFDPESEECEDFSVEEFLSALYVYPNPVKNIVNIDNQNLNQIELLEIVDMNGKKIMKQKNLSNFTQIDLGMLSSGLYFLQIQTKDGINTSLKLIKE